jgi:amidase
MTNSKDWQAIAEAKRASVAASLPTEWQIPTAHLPSNDITNVTSIPTTCGILTPREIEITDSLTAEGLVEKLSRGEYTAVEVTRAFCKRAVIAHQLVCPPFSLKLDPRRPVD